MFGLDGMPGRTSFDLLFLSRHPELRRARPTNIESVRADASTPEAVAKFFDAFRFLCRDLGITLAVQVWNTDESMMNALALTETTPVTVLAPKETASADFISRSIQSGAEAASLVSTVCADGSWLPLFVVVTGCGGRLPLSTVEDEGNGKQRRVLMAAYLDESAEVQRRESPGVDGSLWEVYAAFVARVMRDKSPTECKLLLMDGCMVHLSVVGLTLLKFTRVLVLMISSHLSLIL